MGYSIRVFSIRTPSQTIPSYAILDGQEQRRSSEMQDVHLFRMRSLLYEAYGDGM